VARKSAKGVEGCAMDADGGGHSGVERPLARLSSCLNVRDSMPACAGMEMGA